MGSEEEDGGCKRERMRLEGLLRRREEAGAAGLGQEMGVEVAATPVRGTRMRISTGTGILEIAQNCLRVEKRTGILANTLISSTGKSVFCTAAPVSELIM